MPLFSVFLTGCFTQRDVQNPGSLSATEALSTASGAVLGGAAAYAVSDGDSVETALGGVAGGATGYGISNYYKNQAVTCLLYTSPSPRDS